MPDAQVDQDYSGAFLDQAWLLLTREAFSFATNSALKFVLIIIQDVSEEDVSEEC